MLPTNDEQTAVNDLTVLVKRNHKNNRAALIYDLFNRPTPKLVFDFLTELDAKNEAYYFILENNLLGLFKAYCQKKGGQL